MWEAMKLTGSRRISFVRRKVIAGRAAFVMKAVFVDDDSWRAVERMSNTFKRDTKRLGEEFRAFIKALSHHARDRKSVV